MAIDLKAVEQLATDQASLKAVDAWLVALEEESFVANLPLTGWRGWCWRA